MFAPFEAEGDNEACFAAWDTPDKVCFCFYLFILKNKNHLLTRAIVGDGIFQKSVSRRSAIDANVVGRLFCEPHSFTRHHSL